MKIKDFMKMLKKTKPNDEIVFSSDEELNCIRTDGEIAKLEDGRYVIYGFDGSEEEQDEI